MAALTGTLIAAGYVPFRDLQARQETWSVTTTTTGVADEWLDVGAEILGVIGVVALQAGPAAAPNVVLNASGTSVTAGTNPGNLGIEANGIAGTHIWNITVIVRP
jgi:hypothetical protein